MKNLFLVVSKEKIYAYVVSIMTVVVIFFMSGIINSDLENTEEISANIVDNNSIENTSNEAVEDEVIGDAISINVTENAAE